MKLNKNMYYYPAAMPGLIQLSKTKGLQHWDEYSYFQYPALLISAFYGMNSVDIRKEYNLPKEIKILGDSGGFQALTQQEYLDHLKVMKWLELNCDEGFTYDIPPVNPENFAPLPKDKFEKLIYQNMKNACEMLDIRTNKEFKLILVVHGSTFETLDYNVKVLNELGKTLDDFDGISLSNKNSNPFVIAEMSLWIIRNIPENKRFHFLGLSGTSTVPLMLYILSERKDIITTWDSSSYTSGAKRREFWIEKPNKTIANFGRENHGLKKVPCDCPVCNKNTVEDYLKDDKLIPGSKLSLHNLYISLRYFKNLINLVGNRELFKEYINEFITNKAKTAFKFTDEVLKSPQKFDELKHKYNSYFYDGRNQIDKTKNLFGFTK